MFLRLKTGNGRGMFISYVKCISTHLWSGAVTYDKYTTVLISHIAECHEYLTTWEWRVLTMEEKQENVVMRFVWVNGKIVYFRCCVGVKYWKQSQYVSGSGIFLGNRKLSLYHRFLTHWGRVTHRCVSKLTIIDSDNGFSPGRRQAIIWTNAGMLLIEYSGTNFSEISIGIQTFSFRKMHLKMSSAK